MKNKSSMAFASLALTCLISAVYPEIFAAEAAQSPPGQFSDATLSYSDLADLADASSLVAVARIRNIVEIEPERAPDTPYKHKRLYVEAEVSNLIRGDGGISPRIRYLYDAVPDRRGRTPKLKKTDVILFARPGGRPGEIQLVSRDAQIPATAATIDRVKAILSDLMAPNAAPRIIGVGDAFHVAGTVAGEGETQIFLRTENGDPVSLSILRRPGQEPKWAVALGEIVDEAARAPAAGTLLWYRLACALPPSLPPRSVHALSGPDADAARADYGFVLQSLGPCGRTGKTR